MQVITDAVAVGNQNSQERVSASIALARLKVQRSKTALAAAPEKSPSSIYSSLPPTAAVPFQMPQFPTGPIKGTELVELHKRLKRLQNGSDIRGIAVAGIPNEPVTLTPGVVFFIGQAFASWLKDTSDGRLVVSIGSDPRISGPLVQAALIAGLASAGAEVHTFGLATTPCMFYSIIDTAQYAGAIMITASHMPFNSNGLKFFTAEGGLKKGDITEILQRATLACAEAAVLLGEPLSEGAHLTRAALQVSPEQVKQVDYLPKYAAALRDMIKKGVNRKDSYHLPLAGFKIVVDAGNGSGGFYAEQVLAPLGADTAGSRYLDPDGTFPNHIPNPEHPSAMASGAEAVLGAKADMGIVFDTDVDRSAIVDRYGKEINSNRFIALMAAVVLREHPGSTIVTDSVTSNGLGDFITKLGGKHCRFKRGYKNVISKGVSLNREGVETHLMMETSGHGAVKENNFLDDGAYMATKVVIELVRRQLSGGGDLRDLLADLKEPLESREYRIRISGPNFKEDGAKVLDAFHAWISAGGPGPHWKLDPINHEGWRVNVDEGDSRSGWLLLRQSLHDPLLVLNVESEVQGGVRASTQSVLDFLLKECSTLPLDVSSLQA
eukprot:CAMPEP_0202892036 /NCGR_PEP_ID=MMETSP1392-20130828/1893_1 /ASSEMBLY_ACC=CAM_ASM_000868 /TAXON_ID=225041 /ORGANISM="Chlamydomonas chlamydogama, Strain SAG 11-48b" /LENGTH=606 /DNA_ID=CAMNT_0049575911 /DNA_START=302 /DNA_END=2123 /DNA_ORIENTATION=-